jgi:hypothetical protein
MKRKVTDLKPNEAILISNDSERDAILQLIEYAGYRWEFADKPTQWNPIDVGYGYPISIHTIYDKYNLIGFYPSDYQLCQIEYPATDFIGSEGEMERGITITKQNGEVISAETKFDQAIKLLRDLADLQNGAPLEQHRAEWEQTMDEVYTFLNEHEPRNTPTNDHPNQPRPNRQAADS